MDSASSIIDPQKQSREATTLILKLLHDPHFLRFERELEEPNIFRVAGRTYTETWHSALLGWLFHSKSSHGLGDYPLKLLILLAADRNQLSVEDRGIDLQQLLAMADFSQATAEPNEDQPKEKEVDTVGRFDVFIKNIFQPPTPWQEVGVIIETKVKDSIKIEQCNRYIAYIEKLKRENIFTIPIFLDPTEDFRDEVGEDSEKLFGHRSWIGLDYRKTYEKIIEPCLQHQNITDFGKLVLSEYVKNLKVCRMNEKPLITTEKDRELVLGLKNKHESAIAALYSILSSQQVGEYPPLESGDITDKKPIRVKIGGKTFESPSIRKLYLRVLEYLYDGNYLQNLELPMSSGGSKQYLIAKDKRHPQGNEFWSPVDYKGYYMETNKSRAQGLKDLGKVLEKCHLKLEIME